jgi:hypothetical protein
MADFLQNDEIMFNLFQPKLKLGFYCSIDGIPGYMVSKLDRPSFTSGEVVIHHINSEFYLKGKSRWETATLELYDPITPSGTQAIMEWIRLSHESLTGRDGYFSMYQKDLTIWSLGPVGDKVEEWTYKNAWIKDAKFGDWDWSSDDAPQTISLTIRYNYPILQY